MPTERLSNASAGPPTANNDSVRKMGLLPEDLQVLQQDFSESFKFLQEEVLSELSHVHDNVGKQLRQYAERLMVRQQTMLENTVVNCDSLEKAETALLGARQERALHDRPCMMEDASAKPDLAKQDILDGHGKNRRTAVHPSSFRVPNTFSTNLPGMAPEDDVNMAGKELQIAASENGTESIATTTSHPVHEADSQARGSIGSVMSMIQPMGRKSSIVEKEGNTSRLARIEQGKWFDFACAFILISNAIFIGIQIDALRGSVDSPLGYTIVDCLFTFLFLVELMIRMGASPSLCAYFTHRKDWSWNWFDFGVTTFAVVETCVSLAARGSQNALATMRVVRLLRVLRMIRVVRIIRVMSFFRSLRILIAAILGTMKTGIWTVMLLVMIVYLFALVFAQGVADYLSGLEPEEAYTDLQLEDQQLLRQYFGTLPRTIFTLWKAIVGGIDWEVASQALSDLSPFYVAVFVFYIGLLYLAVLNVVAGLFLQTAVEQAQSDLHDVTHEVRQQRHWYAQHIEKIFAHLDKSQDGIVQPAEFEEVMSDTTMSDFLDLLGLQVSDAWTLFKLLDRGGTHNVDAEDFLDGCFRLRGGARSIDIAQLLSDNEWIREQLFIMQAYLKLKFEDPQDEADFIIS